MRRPLAGVSELVPVVTVAGLPREKLQAQRADLLPDRIALRRHKRRRRNRGPRYAACPFIGAPPGLTVNDPDCYLYVPHPPA